MSETPENDNPCHEPQADDHQGHGGHETTDAKARPIALFEVTLLLWVVLAFGLMTALFYYFTHREARLDQSRSPLAEGRRLPPEPRLQAEPATDLKRLRAEEDARLGGYSWVDEGEQLVRIPIERAMDVVADRGLPTRPPGLGAGPYGEPR